MRYFKFKYIRVSIVFTMILMTNHIMSPISLDYLTLLILHINSSNIILFAKIFTYQFIYSYDVIWLLNELSIVEIYQNKSII